MNAMLSRVLNIQARSPWQAVPASGGYIDFASWTSTHPKKDKCLQHVLRLSTLFTTLTTCRPNIYHSPKSMVENWAHDTPRWKKLQPSGLVALHCQFYCLIFTLCTEPRVNRHSAQRTVAAPSYRTLERRTYEVASHVCSCIGLGEFETSLGHFK